MPPKTKEERRAIIKEWRRKKNEEKEEKKAEIRRKRNKKESDKLTIVTYMRDNWDDLYGPLKGIAGGKNKRTKAWESCINFCKEIGSKYTTKTKLIDDKRNWVTAMNKKIAKAEESGREPAEALTPAERILDQIENGNGDRSAVSAY